MMGQMVGRPSPGRRQRHRGGSMPLGRGRWLAAPRHHRTPKVQTDNDRRATNPDFELVNFIVLAGLVPATHAHPSGKMLAERRGCAGRALPDSHKSPKFPAMMDGFEAKEALEDDDWSRRSVVPGPAAEACANPCRIGERAFGMRVLLWSGPTFESGADGF